MTITILQKSVEDIDSIDQTFDLVYMDPPFGLQRDFTMQEENGQQKGFSDKWESFDDYTDWYANVINSCWAKLNKNGWMYTHNNFMGNALVMSKIDRKIRDSFYTNISWKRSGPKNNIKNGWGNIVDSILVFRKGSPYFEVEYTSLDPVYAANSFNNKDDVGYYALAKVTGEKSRPCARFEYKGYNPVYGFRITKEKLEELSAQDLLHYGTNNIYKKIYSHESKGVPVQNLWDDVYFISRSEKNKRKYPTQKPLKLLQRIIKASSESGGWVLDPFCGSGTTAIAAMELGRNCITMDVNPDAISIAQQTIDELSTKSTNALAEALY
jgi:DNA modification methylase|tara:strand:- start:2000 stop:2974 length:975 start_codon:yes stop_codon:yes gene_type:complete